MNINKFIFAFCLVTSLAATSACAHDQGSSVDQVSVIGVGEVEAEPDQAILSVSIKALESTIQKAKKVADQRYAQILAVIDRLDIPRKQAKLTNINSYPEYEWSKNKRIYKGERVSRSISITVNDLDKVSPLMQSLVKNGISTVNGIKAGFQDPMSLQRQALAAASQDAKLKAKFIAEQLDRRVGEAFNIIEQNTAGPIFRQRNYQSESFSAVSRSQASPPPETFGTQKIKATLSVSFKLQ